MSPTLNEDALDSYITGNYGEDQFADDFGIADSEESYTSIDEELDNTWVR